MAKASKENPGVGSVSKRRSQRLFAEVPVSVAGELWNHEPFVEETRTLVISAHGGLVEMKTVVQPGQKVVVQNLRTKEAQESRVVLSTPAENGKNNVAVEFTSPSPTFWRVSFPPEDWTSRHPDSKFRA